MKLCGKVIEKDSSGCVKLIAEEAEDMWHIYNLLARGDQLYCSTVRKVVSETDTGSTDKSSVRLNLNIIVETIFFDVQVCVLRVNGRNMSENKYVKMGAYHTLDLELNRQFKITKEEWDIIALERIDEACDISKRADIAAVILEEGLANLCLVTQSMTIVRTKIQTSIPKKRRGAGTDHEKGVKKFYDQIMQAIVKYVDFSIVKVLVIASPGFVKDDLFKYINETCSKEEYRAIRDNRSKFLLVHSSSGQKQALSEILEDENMRLELADTKYALEVKNLQTFYRMLSVDPLRACYGYDHVLRASEQGAVETLMMTDALFRADNMLTRKRYVHIVELVRSFKGKTFIFSSLHTSGEQLSNLTGIAAILHYPMPELEEDFQSPVDRAFKIVENSG